MSKKKRPKRLSKEETKQQMAFSGGASNWFNLPDGIETWAPEKKGRFNIDILPYEVTTKNHPEDGIEAGVLWFRTHFGVHHGVGTKGQSIVCPRTIGKKCCICEEADKLKKKDKDRYKETIDQLYPQRFVAMNILHPDDSEQVTVFIMSYGKFDKVLREELQEEENDEHLDFYQVDKGGRLLKVRFSPKSYQGKSYLQATDFKFRDREEMNEEEILDQVMDLDDLLNVLPSEKIEALFLEGDDKEEEKEPETEEEFDVDDPEEEEEEEEKPKRKLKKKPEPEEEEDDWDDDPEDEPVDKDSPEPEDDEVECKACEGSGKASKGGECKPCKGEGYLPVKKEEEEEPEPEKEEEPEEDNWDENEEPKANDDAEKEEDGDDWDDDWDE